MGHGRRFLGLQSQQAFEFSLRSGEWGSFAITATVGPPSFMP